MDLEIQRDRVLMAYKKQFLLLYIDLLKTRGLKLVRITEKSFQMNVKMNHSVFLRRYDGQTAGATSTIRGGGGPRPLKSPAHNKNSRGRGVGVVEWFIGASPPLPSSR